MINISNVTILSTITVLFISMQNIIIFMQRVHTYKQGQSASKGANIIPFVPLTDYFNDFNEENTKKE